MGGYREAGMVECRRVAAAMGAMSRAMGGAVGATRRVVGHWWRPGSPLGMRQLCSG